MSTSGNVSIFIAGDSTAATYVADRAPMAGWGQMFQAFFYENVSVHNYAKNGASTNTFIAEGRLQTILEFIQAGDYLFIQFGHNDQKPRGTEAATTYKQNLATYINEARAKGAIPILLTSVNRRKFDELGRLVHTLGDYPQATREIACEMDVPCIDLLEKTKRLYESLGAEGSRSLFTMFERGEHPNYPEGIEDNTHFCETGALQVAALVIEGIKESIPQLATFLYEEVSL
ncbi:rhamnogalacturonan acetylesterase [Bacillus sp. FJAT-50079]|uniref:rhamnogalacturonan acetylesterase n=1 Tax=Bacillus sp. FJAT-50079 TaxID=2833577 RepID=UPI001BCA2605|nr:rhamnogalacturonan acetylesterase [Bacillus sp. FJAT-50079]MBS4207833.1 rhamnogalacturonan acetylesterase [Bacillus sp. FJAT-50079]